MHSLDVDDEELGPGSKLNQASQQQSDTRTEAPLDESSTLMSRPFGANRSDEYALLLHATSDDFIGLRRVLLASPLVAAGRYSSLGQLAGNQEELSLSASIFAWPPSNQLEGGGGGGDDDVRSSPAHEEGANLVNSPNESTLGHTEASFRGPTDSWDRFNGALLRFLNNYSKQIRRDQAERLALVEQQLRRTQRRRSSLLPAQNEERSSISPVHRSGDHPAINEPDSSLLLVGRSQSLLTFACMAREGNPLTNLTFDWHFGDHKLAEKPALLYANDNSSFIIQLARRLDTRTLLSPFQMSLLTISVIAQSANEQQPRNPLARSMSQTADGTQTQANKTVFMRAPVIKSRYQSFYDSLKANNNEPTASGNIQSVPDLAADYLSEHNWREKLGQLLKCSVANSIGASDLCYAQVNLAQRELRSAASAAAAGHSLYELSKWRLMPSLAQKSLLIMSLLIGCTLILLASLALLVGPHLRAMQLALQKAHHESDGSSRDETGTNTGQSSSSQKSSVLGLLVNGSAGCSSNSGASGSHNHNNNNNNNADSSLQGSSDDDSSARLNQLDSGICIVSNNINHLRNTLSSEVQGERGTGYALSAGHQALSSLTTDQSGASMNYDRPRNVAPTRLIYQPEGGNFNLTDASRELTDLDDNYANFHYHQSSNHYHNQWQQPHQQQKQQTKATSSTLGAASSRFLASLRLRPFAKFKVDRIGDLARATSATSQRLHTRNLSNSETATTGLSSNISGADGYESSATQQSPNELASQAGHFMPHNQFGAPQFRHSYGGPRRHQPVGPLSQAMPPAPSLRDGYHMQSDRRDQLLKSVHETEVPDLHGSLSPASVSQMYRPMPNAMDEFLRRRGLDTSNDSSTNGFDSNDYDDATALALSYGSHSIRNHSSTLQALRNNLLVPARFPRNSTTGPKPPIFSRPTSTLTYSKPAPPAPPPPSVAARSSQQHAYYNQQVLHPSPMAQFSALSTGMQLQQQQLRQQQQQQRQQHFSNTQFDFSSNNSHQLTYANSFDIHNSFVPTTSHPYQQQQAPLQFGSPEHIYDVNAYATPEQTPRRQANMNLPGHQQLEANGNARRQDSERLAQPRVSQLIQNFDMNLPTSDSN